MSAPTTPADFKALISDPSATMCGNFVKTLLRLPLVLWQFVNWWLDDSGNVSKAGRRQIIPPGARLDSFVILPDDGNWLLCDGRQVNRATYPELYSAIGDAFGVSSDPLQFKLPDCRARSPVTAGTFPSGASIALGGTTGEEFHTLLTAEMPKHRHLVVNTDELASQSVTPDLTGAQSIAQKSIHAGDNDQQFVAHGTTTEPTLGRTSETGNDAPHNNLPPLFGILTYIKS